MEKTNFETAMREKLVECDTWINDKDAAIERLTKKLKLSSRNTPLTTL